MRLYRDGTLLKDVHDNLWLITGRSRHWKTEPDCYVIVRLYDGLQIERVYKIIHMEYDLVSEA